MRRRFIEDVVVVAEHRSPGYDAAHPETGDRYGPWRCAAASDAPNSATATCRSLPSLPWTCRPSESVGDPSIRLNPGVESSIMNRSSIRPHGPGEHHG